MLGGADVRGGHGGKACPGKAPLVQALLWAALGGWQQEATGKSLHLPAWSPLLLLLLLRLLAMAPLLVMPLLQLMPLPAARMRMRVRLQRKGCSLQRGGGKQVGAGACSQVRSGQHMHDVTEVGAPWHFTRCTEMQVFIWAACLPL